MVWELFWRMLNVILAMLAGYLLVRTYSRFWRTYTQPDKQVALGIIWLLTTVVVGALENSLRDFEPGPRTVSLTLALAVMNVGLLRLANRRRTDRST